MTEQLGEPTESNEPAISMRYEEEAASENLLHMMQDAGSALATQSFPDIPSAREAGVRFCQEWDAQVDACKELDMVNMRAEGSMIHISNTDYKEGPDGSILIKYSNNPPFKLLEPMGARHFQYRRVFHSIGGTRTSDEYNVTPFIIGKDLSASRRVHDVRLGFPMTSVFFQTSVMVPCMNEVEIESINLRHERRRVNAIKKLAAYAGLYPDIINDLKQIDEEMFEAKGGNNEMKRVDALRELGRVGIVFSSLGFKHEDALNSAIETTLGEDRHLTVSGNIYTLDDANELTQYRDLTFKGKLVNVITNPPALDISKGQTLTLTSLSSPASKDTYYVPLSEINSVHF